MEKRELIRQAIHVVAGIAFIAVLAYFGRINLIAISLLLLFAGSLLINFKLTGRHIPIAHDIGEVIEREKARFPGWGAAWYLIGILLLAAMLSDNNEIIAGIFILAVPDGLATIAGIRGDHKLPYNKKKTVEGTVAFFVSALAAYFFIGPKIVPLAMLSAIVESSDLPIDDNFGLPLLCAVYLFLF